MQRMLEKDGVRTYDGDLCCYDLKQVVAGGIFHQKAHEVLDQESMRW